MSQNSSFFSSNPSINPFSHQSSQLLYRPPSLDYNYDISGQNSKHSLAKRSQQISHFEPDLIQNPTHSQNITKIQNLETDLPQNNARNYSETSSNPSGGGPDPFTRFEMFTSMLVAAGWVSILAIFAIVINSNPFSNNSTHFYPKNSHNFQHFDANHYYFSPFTYFLFFLVILITFILSTQCWSSRLAKSRLSAKYRAFLLNRVENRQKLSQNKKNMAKNTQNLQKNFPNNNYPFDLQQPGIYPPSGPNNLFQSYSHLYPSTPSYLPTQTHNPNQNSPAHTHFQPTTPTHTSRPTQLHIGRPSGLMRDKL